MAAESLSCRILCPHGSLAGYHCRRGSARRAAQRADPGGRRHAGAGSRATSSCWASAARWGRRWRAWRGAPPTRPAAARRVIGVSRFSSAAHEAGAPGARRRDDPLRPARRGRGRAACPTRRTSSSWPAGSSARPGTRRSTWAMNAYLPAVGVPPVRPQPDRRVLDRQRLRPDAGRPRRLARGRRPAPVGEYAMSCLGRERMFEHFSRTRGIPRGAPPAQLRRRDALRRARRPRAARVWAGEPIDLAMGYLNVDLAGRRQRRWRCGRSTTLASPPLVVNVAGPEELSGRGPCERGAGPRCWAGRRASPATEAARRAAEQRRAPAWYAARDPPSVDRAAADRLDRRLGRRAADEPAASRRTSSRATGGSDDLGHADDDPTRTQRVQREHASHATPLRSGLVIPAHPLALTPRGTLDERRQRALTRYYARRRRRRPGRRRAHDAVRDPRSGDRPVRAGARAGARGDGPGRPPGDGLMPLVRIAGVCGADRRRRCAEAALLARPRLPRRRCSAWPRSRDATDDELIAHCRAVAEVIPVVGFYLQPAVGGRVLGYAFWRRFAEIDRVVAIKIAPFNRYQTLDVVRAVVEAGRDDIALYTGNDDNIVVDLLTPYRVRTPGKADRAADRRRPARALGGLDRTRRRAARRVPRGHARAGPGVAAADRRRGHRRQRRRLRRRQRLRRLHRRDPRGAAPAGPARQHPDAQRRDARPGPGRRARPRLRAYPHLIDDEFVADHVDSWRRP